MTPRRRRVDAILLLWLGAGLVVRALLAARQGRSERRVLRQQDVSDRSEPEGEGVEVHVGIKEWLPLLCMVAALVLVRWRAHTP